MEMNDICNRYFAQFDFHCIDFVANSKKTEQSQLHSAQNWIDDEATGTANVQWIQMRIKLRRKIRRWKWSKSNSDFYRQQNRKKTNAKFVELRVKCAQRQTVCFNRISKLTETKTMSFYGVQWRSVTMRDDDDDNKAVGRLPLFTFFLRLLKCYALLCLADKKRIENAKLHFVLFSLSFLNVMWRVVRLFAFLNLRMCVWVCFHSQQF